MRAQRPRDTVENMPERTDTDMVPLFPLSSLLVPGLLLPLRLFEPRYLALAADLLNVPADQRQFGVVAIRHGREVGLAGGSELYDIGTIAAVTDLSANTDGTFNVQTSGTRRFRILDLDVSKAYLQARVQFLTEPEGEGASAWAQQVAVDFEQYRRVMGLAVNISEMAPEVLSYVVTAALVAPIGDRQMLLSAPDTATRLALAHRALRQELSIMRVLASVPAVDLARSPVSVN